MTDLMMWVSSIVAKGANKGMTESDVVMVAHEGMRLDYVVLVKTMIMCGLSLPLHMEGQKRATKISY